jgi:hypothetical protein
MANFAKGTFTIVPNKEVLRGKSPELQCVYYWLCDHSDDKGVCFPSYERLAECSGVHRTTVIKKVAELVALGLLVKTTRTTKDEHQSNLYQLVITGGGSSPELPPSSPERLELTPLNSIDTTAISEIGISSSLKTPLAPKELEGSSDSEGEEEVSFVVDEDSDGYKAGRWKKPSGKSTEPDPDLRGAYEVILKECEAYRGGSKFMNRISQYAALKKMRVAGIPSYAIIERFKELYDKGYGGDMQTVLRNFDKRPADN